jgi:hypothetical protein
MTEKKCKYCAMIIPKEAKICPHCRKRQGWTLPAKLGLGIIIFIVIIGIIAQLFGPSPSHKYTKEQKKIAKEANDILINGLMKEGIIKELKGEGKLQIVCVDGALWGRSFTYDQKKDLLGNISKTNEIMGYTPWVEIRDYHSGEVYGALKPPLTFEIYK